MQVTRYSIITSVMAKTAMKAMKAKTAMKGEPVKKPKITKPKAARPRAVMTAEGFKKKFIGCTGLSTSLIYPEAGGRRSDLALLCKQWVRAARMDDGTYKAFNLLVMKLGFQAIHAEQKASQGEEQWAVGDNQCVSWSHQMAKRLQNLIRHCSQASQQDPVPQWLNLCLSETETKKEPIESSTADAAATVHDEEAESEEKPAESEAESADDEDKSAASAQDEEEEDDDDEKFELGPTDEQCAWDNLAAGSQAASGTKLRKTTKQKDDVATAWIVEFSGQVGRAYRRKAESVGFMSKKNIKDYSNEPIHVAGAKSDDEIVVSWADGYSCSVSGVTNGEIFPDKYRTSNVLPKNGKRGKGKQTAEHLWTGETKDGASMHIAWRSSRGWNLAAIMKNGKKSDQICQIKPELYRCLDQEQDVSALCLKLLREVLTEFGNGTQKRENLLACRDGLLVKYRLAEKTEAPKFKPKAPQAQPSQQKATAPIKPQPKKIPRTNEILTASENEVETTEPPLTMAAFAPFPSCTFYDED